MQRYELLYIMLPTLTENEAPLAASKITGLLQEQGASIVQEVDLGKKRLAYPIKKSHYGYYRLVDFTTEPDRLQRLTQLLSLATDVLRHIIVAKPVKSQATIERAQALRARVAAKRQRLRATEQATGSAALESAAAPSLSPEELEKKLEKILEENPTV